MIPWIVAFAEEVLPEDNDAERQIRFVESRLAATDDAGLWFWEDGGRPVSISGYGGATPNGMRIGPVYTPPELRGRGYATTLVAEQSRWLLGTGRSLCFLYTDLDNPTSNALYRRIGYRMIAEAGEVRFDPRDAASALQHSGGGAGAPSFGTTTNAISPGFTIPRHWRASRSRNASIAQLLGASGERVVLPLAATAACRSNRASSACCSKYICAGATESTSTPITSVQQDRRARRQARATAPARRLRLGPDGAGRDGRGRGRRCARAIRRLHRAARRPRTGRRRRAAPRSGGAG